MLETTSSSSIVKILSSLYLNLNNNNMLWDREYFIRKIHLWRHSIVLALHYFQGMACYRSATLLEVMDSRSFWNMFVFSWVMISYASEVVFMKSIQTTHASQWIKKVDGYSSSRTHAVLDVVLVLSPPLYQLSYHGAEGDRFISDIY